MRSLRPDEQYDSEAIHDGLRKVYYVSEYLRFPFTVEEVANYFLPKSNLTPQQLESMLTNGKFGDLGFKIRDGYLTTNDDQTQLSRSEMEQTSADKLNAASGFANLLTRVIPFIRTVAVTGSVAYGSATKWDDIDLFIVTKRNRLWISALLTLVLVRLNKLLILRPPHLSHFCLSYVHDEQGFLNESQRNRSNPLFARELLKAKPVAGEMEYRKILEDNDWVADLYSRPYLEKLRTLRGSLNGTTVSSEAGSATFSLLMDWVEAMAYAILSRYLRLRAYLMNRRLESEGKDMRVFDPIITSASCVYTSNFYRWLRVLWGE
jgi:nucleotidyltransferase-like protein